jgi:hypothetical protein
LDRKDRKKQDGDNYITRSPSPDVIKLFKSRWVRSAGRVELMAEMRNDYKVLVEKPEGKNCLGAHCVMLK